MDKLRQQFSSLAIIWDSIQVLNTNSIQSWMVKKRSSPFCSPFAGESRVPADYSAGGYLQPCAQTKCVWESHRWHFVCLVFLYTGNRILQLAQNALPWCHFRLYHKVKIPKSTQTACYQEIAAWLYLCWNRSQHTHIRTRIRGRAERSKQMCLLTQHTVTQTFPPTVLPISQKKSLLSYLTLSYTKS